MKNILKYVNIVLKKQNKKKNKKNTENITPIIEEEKIKKFEDWDFKVDEWIDDTIKNNQIDIDKNKLIIEKLKTPSNKDVFDDDDFIFKECYI